MANRNRNKGHAYERKVRREMIALGFEDCQTARYASREKDDQKVDLVNTEPFNVQCKAVETGINYSRILGEMPKDENYNLILHKRARRETVTMRKDDFYELLSMLKANQVINP